MTDAPLSFRKSANIDRVTDKRKDSLFRLVDTDGSGTIDAQEFAVLYDAIKKDLAEELEKEAALAKEASSAKRRFKMLLLFVAVLVSFLAASVAANFAVMFTVVDQAITTTATSTGVLGVKGSDTIVKTATATQDVPLIVAPVLDLEMLAQVKSLSVTYGDGGSKIQAALNILGVRKHNATFVEFVTATQGEMVQMLNGQALLVRYPTSTNGLEETETYPICGANATCSAFQASGIDVDAAFARAKEELQKSGLTDVARRLDGWSSPYADAACGNGNWYYTPVCGYAYTPETVAIGWWTDFGDCFGGATDMPEQDQDDWWGGFPTTWGPSAFPPPKTSISVLSHSGYPGTRHMVFILHGKGQQSKDTYGLYCADPDVDEVTIELVTHGTQVYADPCPALQHPAFRHLVFIFATGGVLDASFGYANGWSSDIFSSAYETSMNAWVGGLFGHVADAATAAGWDELYDETPAFTFQTEIMVVGFSDGAGYGMFLQWMKAFTAVTKGVTQVIALDYWAHNNYENWLTNYDEDAGGYVPGALDAKIYTVCDSNIYIDAMMESLFDDEQWGEGAPSTTESYLSMSGWDDVLPFKNLLTGDMTGFIQFKWEDRKCKRVQVLVNGMDSNILHNSHNPDLMANNPIWTDMCSGSTLDQTGSSGDQHYALFLNSLPWVVRDLHQWVRPPRGGTKKIFANRCMAMSATLTQKNQNNEINRRLAEPATKERKSRKLASKSSLYGPLISKAQESVNRALDCSAFGCDTKTPAKASVKGNIAKKLASGWTPGSGATRSYVPVHEGSSSKLATSAPSKPYKKAPGWLVK